MFVISHGDSALGPFPGFGASMKLRLLLLYVKDRERVWAGIAARDEGEAVYFGLLRSCLGPQLTTAGDSC